MVQKSFEVFLNTDDAQNFLEPQKQEPLVRFIY
jgi:hypothetical protein